MPQPAAPPAIPVAILGPTGYTGLELIELLLLHPALRIAYLASARTSPPRIDEEFPRLRGRLAADIAECRPIDHDRIAAAARLAFLCLPHEAAMEHTPPLLARGVKVVDLSAAYRLKDAAVYEQAYGHRHTDPAGLGRAVYGLTEFNREQIRAADLVANPGCYPTAAAIALVPLLRAGLINPGSIIINAASGVSGAGRQTKQNLHYVEANENFSAYAIGVHRHQPEIAQSLAMFGARAPAFEGGTPVALHRHDERSHASSPPRAPLFVPHLLPVERGILETIYAEPTSPAADTATIVQALQGAYAGERFIIVRGDAPALRDVQHTNTVHVNGRVVGGRIVLIAAEDNLVKGAAGQAIQNANVMLGLDECIGLS